MHRAGNGLGQGLVLHFPSGQGLRELREPEVEMEFLYSSHVFLNAPAGCRTERCVRTAHPVAPGTSTDSTSSLRRCRDGDRWTETTEAADPGRGTWQSLAEPGRGVVSGDASGSASFGGMATKPIRRKADETLHQGFFCMTCDQPRDYVVEEIVLIESLQLLVRTGTYLVENQ